MTAMAAGASLVEKAVRERAEARGAAITRMSWNGVEGLKARQQVQTLLVSATQSVGRASFTQDQLRTMGEQGELTEQARSVVDDLIHDLHGPAAPGTSPRGG